MSTNFLKGSIGHDNITQCNQIKPSKPRVTAHARRSGKLSVNEKKCLFIYKKCGNCLLRASCQLQKHQKHIKEFQRLSRYTKRLIFLCSLKLRNMGLSIEHFVRFM